MEQVQKQANLGIALYVYQFPPDHYCSSATLSVDSILMGGYWRFLSSEVVTPAKTRLRSKSRLKSIEWRAKSKNTVHIHTSY